LENRVILITGATAGIGKATALHFARLGVKVVAAARDTSRGAELFDEIKTHGGDAIFIAADMAVENDIKHMVSFAVETYGGLDYAFNNAGMFSHEAALHDQADDDWAQMIAVNLTGVYRCMKYEIAAMLNRPGAACAIVNNASTVGHRGSSSSGPAYTAAKHGVIGLTRQAAITYANKGIRINAVSPGPTQTDVTATVQSLPADQKEQLLGSLNPTALLVSPEEIAEAVAFLCSDAAKMINGHSLPLDGGQLAKL
jgi:NAD(P)-dependent dehydrogenase (short-subunit alcohol dehydrogenase family)